MGCSLRARERERASERARESERVGLVVLEDEDEASHNIDDDGK